MSSWPPFYPNQPKPPLKPSTIYVVLTIAVVAAVLLFVVVQ